MELPVLHRDDTVLVIDKPSGWLVHNSAFTRTRERTVLTVVREAFGDGFAPVHRLDRGTSGVLMLASGGDNIRRWQEALTAADKSYLALVRGELRAPVDIDHPVTDERGVSREARSRVEPVWWLPEPRCSLVRVRVYTGRTHQVRRHCHHISHHIIGDANYGKGPLNREFRARYGLARLALHAERLACTHPYDGSPMDFASPLPPDLTEALARIRGLR